MTENGEEMVSPCVSDVSQGQGSGYNHGCLMGLGSFKVARSCQIKKIKPETMDYCINTKKNIS